MESRRARAIASPLLALSLLAGTSSVAGATDFTVTKLADTSDGACNADCSLREAIIAANANPGADRIILGAAQTYTLTRAPADPPGALVAGTGDLDITTGNLTIDGNGSIVTVAAGLDRVFDILGLFTVTINSLTIQGGVARGFLSLGGGLYIRDAAVVLNNSTVGDNGTAVEDNTQDAGGGIAVIGEYKAGSGTLFLASLTLNNSTVSSNSGLNGGGIICVLCTLTINNSTLRGNAASGGDGGGIAVVGNASTLAMTGSNLGNNHALNGGRGGGLSVPFGTSVSTLTRSRIAGNTGGLGSAVFNSAGGITATNNWWGCNYGPGTGGAGCASTPNGVAGTMTTAPHLVMLGSASPPSIARTGSSSMTADFTFNSASADTSAGGTLPNGLSVAFAGTLGTFATPTTQMMGGKAIDVFTAGTTLGTASLSATRDGQTVSTSVPIMCGVIELSPPTVANGWVDVAYPPTQLTQAGLVGAPTFGVTSGALPPGMSLSSAGALSGTPTAIGTFNFTVTAADAGGCSGSRSYSIAIGRLAELVYPPVAKPLPGAIATFAWDSGLGNVEYSLWIGFSPGGMEVYGANDSGLMRTVGGLPTDGRTIYVRLWSRVGSVWGFRDTVYQAATSPGTFDTGVTLVPGDYDGDNKADYAVWLGEPGLWYVQQSSTNYATWLTLPWGRLDLGHRPVQGDYDGDGKTDPAVWEAGSGTWYIVKSSTNYQQQLAVQWGNAADRPVPGDYDGDGKTDPAVWEEGTGMWYALKSSTNYAQYLAQQWGNVNQGHRPLPEDYDGDGKTDPAVWEEGTGMWYALKSSTNYAQYFAQQWGSLAQGHRPVPADYDDDGKADPAVWEQGTGIWHILKSSTNYAQLQQQWGSAAEGDVPVAGDYSGDGKTEPAVYRASTGIWYFLSGWNP